MDHSKKVEAEHPAGKGDGGEFKEMWRLHTAGKLKYVVVVGSVLTSFYVSADALGVDLYKRAKLDSTKTQLMYGDEKVHERWSMAKVKEPRFVLTAQVL